MISISQKCQYALRAVFELGRQSTGRPVTIGQIAKTQAIPPRFLELILNELKQAGFVRSRRGVRGGYMLAVDPGELTVGKLISVVDGRIDPVKCVAVGGSACPLRGNCCFIDMWKQAGNAMSEVFNNTTFQSLMDKQRRLDAGSSYSI